MVKVFDEIPAEDGEVNRMEAGHSSTSWSKLANESDRNGGVLDEAVIFEKSNVLVNELDDVENSQSLNHSHSFSHSRSQSQNHSHNISRNHSQNQNANQSTSISRFAAGMILPATSNSSKAPSWIEYSTPNGSMKSDRASSSGAHAYAGMSVGASAGAGGGGAAGPVSPNMLTSFVWPTAKSPRDRNSREKLDISAVIAKLEQSEQMGVNNLAQHMNTRDPGVLTVSTRLTTTKENEVPTTDSSTRRTSTSANVANNNINNTNTARERRASNEKNASTSLSSLGEFNTHAAHRNVDEEVGMSKEESM